MWYYEHKNQQTGPVEVEEAKHLIETGVIQLGTRVWQESMENWQPAAKTELLEYFPEAGESEQSASVVPPPLGVRRPVDPLDVKRLNQWFAVYWICLAIGFPLLLVTMSVFENLLMDFMLLPWMEGMGWGFVAAVVLLIVTAVFFCRFLYKLWSLIPPNLARTTPGKAVGFICIPVFNLYWNFIAIYGLGKALKAEAEQNGISYGEYTDLLNLAYCIGFCCFVLPGIGTLFQVIGLVAGVIGMKQMKNVAIALIQKQLA